ncbi:hypothetical protein NKR23_g6990 [Pleurostoma richardsiae]|uniref:Uncharacterized protein n=1 Tax=Pleurostoma richardsiae TaxID=41990 RepID=A0AA38VH79_9PEZI|nr:hypothetical protein NKR23_g6990 [Pleurostoma richardsiae]
MSSKERKVAYMEEVDEGGNAIEDTKTYANSTYAASTAPSPPREQPNTGRTRRERSRRDSSSPGNGLTDSDSTAQPSSAERRETKMKSSHRDRERAREKPSSGKKTVTINRPSAKHVKTAPILQTNSYRRPSDDSSYYGVDPVTTTTSSRPRAHTTRPTSYYGPSRPPLSNQRYYTQPALGTLPTSYPPQAWAAAPAPYPLAPPAMPPQSEYMGGRPQQHQQLLARFNRPQSAIGNRSVPAIQYGGDDYEQENEGRLIRRNSLTRKAREEEDRMRMPPPARPASARPMSLRASPFAPPPPPSAPYSRRVGFEDDDFDGDGSMYRAASPLTPYDYNAHAPVRRPSVGAPSVIYEVGSYRTEVAGKAGRRNSYYGQSVSSGTGSGFEDKLRTASTYQDEVNGGPTVPLTAETLRKAGKNGATSSRSTRSSGSRDESDYRRSATTRTTRSSNDEDITIRVKGEATLKVGGAEMQCRDAEININSRSAGGTHRGDSDQGSSYYLEDSRPPRIERPPTRARSNSQAGSYTRTVPIFDSYGYGYPPRPTTPHGWV